MVILKVDYPYGKSILRFGIRSPLIPKRRLFRPFRDWGIDHIPPEHTRPSQRAKQSIFSHTECNYRPLQSTFSRDRDKGKDERTSETVCPLSQERDSRDRTLEDGVARLFEEKAKKDAESQMVIDRLSFDNSKEISHLEKFVDDYHDAECPEQSVNDISLPPAYLSKEAESNLATHLIIRPESPPRVVGDSKPNNVTAINSVDEGTSTFAQAGAMSRGYESVAAERALHEVCGQSASRPLSVAPGLTRCLETISRSTGTSHLSKTTSSIVTLNHLDYDNIDESIPIQRLKLVDTKRVEIVKGTNKKGKKPSRRRKFEYTKTPVTVEKVWVERTGSQDIHMLVKAYHQADDQPISGSESSKARQGVDVDPLENLMRDLQNCHQNTSGSKQTTSPYAGQFVSAMFAGRRYRAMVLSVSEQKREAEVELVDYGDKVTVAFRHIHSLSTKFRALDAQVAEARLR
ncbi:hypothetical protein EVG20_g4249 [Dentipellis fragilis]|uniref:Tudor domain-containing protein n=1 Tax=Dentipellis fragilis TaxID=205917 RepID=A0A4Y9YW76_9AGAM|nr:hypothetical protein EVG20_g4249 [Dentipellis fragilis]